MKTAISIIISMTLSLSLLSGVAQLSQFAFYVCVIMVTGQQTHLSDPTAKGDGVHLFKWTPLLAF
ncbi:hypothetical protein ACIUZ0_36745 [Pseudomonas aeruginosa]